MTSGILCVAAAAGVFVAAGAAVVGVRALRQARTVEVFARPKRPAQPYMLQVNPPSEKVQAMSLPVRRELGAELQREKQA